MKKNDYKLPELEEIKRITDEFLKKADELKEKYGGKIDERKEEK